MSNNETGLAKRKVYKSDEPQPVYHYEITVDGKALQRNQECTLERGIGYPAGRYRFCYAEECPDGNWCLVFFGPTRRSKQRWRQLWDQGAAIRTVHRAVGPGTWAGACGQEDCDYPAHQAERPVPTG